MCVRFELAAIGLLFRPILARGWFTDQNRFMFVGLHLRRDKLKVKAVSPPPHLGVTILNLLLHAIEKMDRIIVQTTLKN